LKNPFKKNPFFGILCITLKCSIATGLFASDTTYVVLSAGVKHGSYYKTAFEISDHLNRSLKTYEIRPVTSQGSIDNLNRFKEGVTDMFIVQRDVAVTAYYSDKDYKNMEVIMPLFPEALQIFIRSDTTSIISFNEFKSKIVSGEISHLAIGPQNSTTNITTTKVLNLLGVDAPVKDFYVLSSPENYIDDFLDGKLDAIAYISAPPLEQFVKENIDSISIVSFDHAEMTLLLNHLRNLDHIEIHIKGKTYPFFPSNEVINCVGTWAFLAGRSGLVDDIYNNENVSFVKTIITNSIQEDVKYYMTSGKGMHLFTTYYDSSTYFPTIIRKNNMVVKSEHKSLTHFFRGLPLSDDLNTTFPFRKLTNRWSWSFIPVIILVILIIIYKYRSRIDIDIFWNRYKHFVYTGLGLVITYLIVAESILLMERQFFDTYSVRSPFIGLSGPKIYKWLLLYVLAGYDAGIFPISYMGKLLVTTSIYLGWTNIGLAILFELLFNFNRKKRLSGMKTVNCKQHLVICGWNDQSPKLIKDLMEALEEYVQETLNQKKIVVINEVMKEYLENDNDLKKYHSKRKLEFINGTPRNYKHLEAANIHEAHTVILLADNNTKEADERTLIDALTISRFCREKSNDLTDRIYMIAEINNREFEESLYRADVNEVVCSLDMSNNIIVQTTLNHGIAKILGRLLDYNEFNEFYTIDLRYRKSLRHKNFEELFNILRLNDILLLGIKAAFYENGTEAIDWDDIVRNLAKETEKIKTENSDKRFSDQLKRQYMINPYGIEKYYKADEDDQLIVLARSGKDIEKLK